MSEAGKYHCSCCNKQFARSKNVRRHKVLKHGWDEENKRPASEILKEQMAPKKNILTQAVIRSGIPIDLVTDSEAEDEEEELQSTLTDLYPDVEPSTTRVDETDTSAITSKGETSEPTTLSHKAMTNTASVSTAESADPTQRKPTKPIKVSLAPKAVTDTNQPCQRKQNELAQAKGLAARATAKKIEETHPKPCATTSTASTSAPVEKKSKISGPVHWKQHYVIPPLTELLKYK